MLYVALTRARDRLILTAAKAAGGGLDILQPGLEGLITPASIPFAPALAQPVAPVAPTIPPLPEQIMLYPARAGFAELPVTALSDYAICPLRFKFRHVDGHPGYTSGNGTSNLGMELGKLTHKALELGIDQAETLATYAPPPTANRRRRSVEPGSSLPSLPGLCRPSGGCDPLGTPGFTHRGRPSPQRRGGFGR